MHECRVVVLLFLLVIGSQDAPRSQGPIQLYVWLNFKIWASLRAVQPLETESYLEHRLLKPTLEPLEKNDKNFNQTRYS